MTLNMEVAFFIVDPFLHSAGRSARHGGADRAVAVGSSEVARGHTLCLHGICPQVPGIALSSRHESRGMAVCGSVAACAAACGMGETKRRVAY